MKSSKYIIILLLATGFISCRRDLLNTQPRNLLTKDQIYSSPAGVQAYFATLYKDMPVEDFAFINGRFGRFPDDGHGYTSNWIDETFNANDSRLEDEVWGNLYKSIRNVNTFLREVAEVTNITESAKTLYTAEARFVRAYYYFGLVKYYGGVPILLEPQENPKGNGSELNLPRNKEEEVWDLIKSDLEFAAANLNATSDYGRANKYVALALLSRTMLHAGTIGKYGTVDLGGAVGVPPAKATIYLQAAYDAAKTIITDRKYSLFMKYAPADRVKNFQYLFYEAKASDANTEAIFCKGYDFAATTQTHSQDLMALPNAVKSGIGYANRLLPTLDMVEKFEYTDGRPGTLNIGTQGAYVHYATQDGPFQGKDPRLFGSVIIPGTTFRGSVITSQRGVLVGGVEYNGTNYDQYFDLPTKRFVSNVTPIRGTGNSNIGSQSFWQKKWTDPVTDILLIRDWSSRTSWIDLRLGEIYLNLAEATLELGKDPKEALDAINELRNRAGIVAHTTIDLAKVRHERQVELAFENHAYWDYVRWRRLTTEFTVRQEYGVDIYYDTDSKDYVFKKMPVGGGRTYLARAYYFQIPGGERSKNPLLVNNPGY